MLSCCAHPSPKSPGLACAYPASPLKLVLLTVLSHAPGPVLLTLVQDLGLYTNNKELMTEDDFEKTSLETWQKSHGEVDEAG